MPELKRDFKKEKGKYTLSLAAKWGPLLKVGLTVLSLSFSFSIGRVYQQNQYNKNMYNVVNQAVSDGLKSGEISLDYPPILLFVDELEDSSDFSHLKHLVVLEEGDEIRLGMVGAQPDTIIASLESTSEEQKQADLTTPAISDSISSAEVEDLGDVPWGWRVDPRRPDGWGQ